MVWWWRKELNLRCGLYMLQLLHSYTTMVLLLPYVLVAFCLWTCTWWSVTLLLASVIARLVVTHVTCYHESPHLRKFTPRTLPGKGRLFYHSQVPVLEFTASSPEECGYAHGYLLAPQIRMLKVSLARYHWLVSTLEWCRDCIRCKKREHTRSIYTSSGGTEVHCDGDAFAKGLETLLKREAPHLWTEMEGLVRGYNTFWKEHGTPKECITLTELSYIHSLPDSKHFHVTCPLSAYYTRGTATTLFADTVGGACTTIVHGDKVSGPILGRNMDWIAFGHGGSHSLLMVWRTHKVVAVTFPGMVGVITGWNIHRLCLAMNVCPPPLPSSSSSSSSSSPLLPLVTLNGGNGSRTVSELRLPAVFYNRLVLERCYSTESAEKAISTRRGPLGPYHLTLVDQRGGGTTISFYQKSLNLTSTVSWVFNPPFIRRWRFTPTSTQQSPLITLNFCLPDCIRGSFNSAQREHILATHFVDRHVSTLSAATQVITALTKKPFINSHITLHHLVFRPCHNDVRFAWDNGYAASNECVILPLTYFLEGEQ